MNKKLKSKMLAVLLTITMLVGSLSGPSKSVMAQSTSESFTYYPTDELVADFNFGSDVTADTLYSPETGYGFSNVEYPNPAPGWINNVYYPRVPVYSSGASYVKSVTDTAFGAKAVTGTALEVTMDTVPEPNKEGSYESETRTQDNTTLEATVGDGTTLSLAEINTAMGIQAESDTPMEIGAGGNATLDAIIESDTSMETTTESGTTLEGAEGSHTPMENIAESASTLDEKVETEAILNTVKVTNTALSANGLEISSKVWTETESSGYGVYKYKNTSVFNMDLANADYQVTVTFFNPTNIEYTAFVEAEDITRASEIKVAPGASIEVTIPAILVDGQLNLKFLASSSATSEATAVVNKVYVSRVSILREKTNDAASKPTIFIASDSTVQTYDSYYYPQTGWGQTLYHFFGTFIEEREAIDCDYSQAQVYETEKAIIENRAIGGRSSKSFIEEGKLDDLLEDVKPGDYVMIQWGHNDATYSRPNRYVSIDDFPQYIKYYIDGCRQRGATPILVTPVARYSPKADGTFNSDFEGYRQAMFALGASENVPVLDLTGASLALCESLGVEGAKTLFLHLAAGEYDGAYAGGASDSTHLQYYGAYKFAQCVAKLILNYSTDNQLDDLKKLVVLNIPTAVPAAISNVVTTTVGATSISFTWDKAEGAELYYIYRAELAADETIDRIDFSSAEKYSVSSSTKYTDKNCLGGKTYVYAVRGFNEFGLGEFSQKIAVTTKSSMYKYDFDYTASDPVPEGWIQVVCNQMFDETLGYGWTKAPNNGRNRAGSPYPDANDMTIDFCMAGEFAVNLPNGDYEIKIYSGDLISGGSTIKSDFWAEGVSLGTISAKQSIGTLSATVRIVDGQLNLVIGGQNGYINGMEITPLLLAPSKLSYSELEFTETNAQFLISFDGISEAVSYNIYQKSETDTVFRLVESIKAEDKDSLDARAMVANVGETREYYVTAVTADGTETAPSKSIVIVMIDPNATPPAAPQNLTCVSASRGNIVIQWNPVDGAISYNIYRSARLEGMKGYTGYKKVGESTEPRFVDTDNDLSTNIHYYYKVEAVGKGGVGEKSDALVTPITETLVRQVAETLTDRALVAVDLSGDKGGEINVTTKDKDGNELTKGVYLSWRLFERDPENVTFTVYRNNEVIAANLTVTNCVDPDGKAGDIYRVVGSSDDFVGVHAVATQTWDNYFIELPLEKPADQTMPDGTVCNYTANDMSVGDLDNDGVYELIVKWYPSNARDNSSGGYTGTTIIDAYDFDSATGNVTLMWRIDLGVNIRSGAHYTQFQVWDFDGDGSAELICKTADGSTTYQNMNGTLVETGYVGVCNGAALPTDTISSSGDYRNSSGYVLSGPEYLTIFDGETGRIIDTTDYIPARGSVDAWGDGYGNRVDRFLSAVAYLDGENASAIFARGYYTRTCLTAYDFVDTNNDGIGDKLQKRWAFDSIDHKGSEYVLEAQGNHGLSINDIDADGKDEIVYGALVIDHDGSVKYSTGLGHGDAMHVSDWIPSRPGLEIFSVHEHSDAKYQVEIRDAETGKIIWGYFTGVDTGRGVAGDVDPNYAGAELWANAAWDGTDGGLYSSLSTLDNFIKIADNTPDVNFTIFWDGDLLTELQNHTFNNSAYVPISTNITKWNYIAQRSDKLFESTEVYTSNGTKGNLGLVADILGDWREEIIARCSFDDSKIRIYTSTIVTDYTIPTLMDNFAYRIGIAWQNVGYNQPANLDYLLSEGLVTSTLRAGQITQNSAEILFTDASDGKYGHEITGYEVYRASDGDYTLIDTLEIDELIKVTDDGDLISEPVTPVEYKFDFGGYEEKTKRTGKVKEGWIEITSESPSFEVNGNYGFTEACKSILGNKVYVGNTDPEYADVLNDCVLGWAKRGTIEFVVAVPNGKYEVTYLSNSGSGKQNNTVVAENVTFDPIVTEYASTIVTKEVEVADGTLNVTVTDSGGNQSIYISGLMVKQIRENKITDPNAPTYYYYKDTTLDSDTAYSYKIAAIVDGKTSYMSAPLSVKTLVDIISVPEFEIADIVEDTPIPEGSTLASLLPSTVKVIDSKNNETYAKVEWDVSQLNIAEPGEYTVIAKIAGYGDTITKTVKVVPNEITMYEFTGYTRTGEVEPYYTSYVVENATSLELPSTVVFKYRNGRAEEVAVTWDTSAVDVTTKGTYMAVGTTKELSASDGKFGVQTVKMNIVVKEDYITGFGEISSVEVPIGSSPDDLKDLLPTSLNAIYKSGKTGMVAVQWNTNIDESLLEEEGSFDLTGTVENYSGEVLIKVYVEYKAIWKFDFGINVNDVAPGWTGVTVNSKGGKKTTTDLGIAYSKAKGYGFENDTAVIEGRSEGYTQSGILPAKVYTDFVLPDGQTFLIDVPNGTYNIEYSSGSVYKSSVKVTINNSATVYSVSNTAGTYVIGEINNVMISDGQIALTFPSGNTSRLNAIIIRQVSVDENPTEPTPTPEVTVTPTPEVTVTPTPEVTVTPTPEVTVTPTPEVTVTPTPEITVTPTPEVTVTPTPEITVTPTPEVTVTPTPEITVTPTPEVTATPTPTPKATVTPVPESTVTPVSDSTAAPTATPIPIPQINGKETIKGWDSIIDYIGEIIEGEEDTGRVAILAGENTIIPKEVLSTIQGTDITIELQFVGYRWSICGQDITGENLTDIDLSITKNTSQIPSSLMNTVAGENQVIPLQLTFDGEFGLRATLTIDVTQTNEGRIANLFYYNPTTGTLQLQAVGQVNSAGNVDLSFTHASEYAIVLADEVLVEKEADNIQVVADTDTLYVGGTTGKYSMIRLQLPEVLIEAARMKLIDQVVTYESSDKNVVTVAWNGKLIAKGEGTATITTKITIGNITKTFENTIVVKKAFMEVTKVTDVMKVGDEFSFVVKVHGYKDTDVKFTTTKKSIVVIDKTSGKAKAISKGTDYVVVNCHKQSIKLKVTVK